MHNEVMNKIDIPAVQARMQKASRALWVVLVISAGLCLLQFQAGMQNIFEGYFLGTLFMLGIAVGSLTIWIIHTLTGGRWGDRLKKFYTTTAWTIPIVLLLALPNIFGLKHLYEWMRLSPEALHGKAVYLNMPFFTFRAFLYFGIWTFIAMWLTRFNERLNLAGLFMLVTVFTGTFAGIDWVMSLEYHWFSTMFGILFVEGQTMLAYCSLIVMYVYLENPPEETKDNGGFRDIGNLVLVMVMLWAYMSLGQFLITWMGNLPEEIGYYLHRIRGGWKTISIALIVLHFFLPFFLLLKRSWKKNPQVLVKIASWIIFMRFVDIAWMTIPSLGKPVSSLTLTHAGAALLVVSIYLLILLRQLKNVYASIR